ncbi:MAG: alkaline phosphatase family protein [Leptospiraceae bacterium]|nr:alkaline phosphatase family protein [Leptospiraceae bacterium]
MIIWSIDGFAAGYFDRDEIKESAVWQRLLKRGRLFRPVETTIPSVTYPAHTAMVTGRDAAAHQIHNNHPVDPFNESKGGWTWYLEDVAGDTLWDIARKRGKSVANLQWPVTMTNASRIRYHIPQFDRARGSEEQKLMRVLSTPGLHREIEKHTGVSLTEYSSDSERIRVARYIWKHKRPDLMLLYNPGLDSIEHAQGPYSEAAFSHLETLGIEMEKFLNEAAKVAPRDKVRILIVSDHGFMTFKGKCYPNSILKSMGYIDPKAKKWSYYFETAGGVARLIKNGEPAPFADAAFTEKLNAACPEIEVVTADHNDFQKLRKRYSAKSSLFLVSRGDTVMTAGINKTEYSATPGHTHGFLPDRSDMHTVALMFGPERAKAARINHVKDVFFSTCSWLRLGCAGTKARAKNRAHR